MNVFLTGGTGFIGKNLISELVKRKGEIYVLVRESSKYKLDEIAQKYDFEPSLLTPVIGDINQPLLGLSEESIKDLDGKVDEFIHAAAIYDIEAPAEEQYQSNVEGTRQALALAEQINAKCFNQISSIAAGGLYKGTWTEKMFKEAVDLDSNPYLRTKHDSEGIVRETTTIPWRIFRPAIVVGHSQTGEIDKIDGPYYFFKVIQRLRNIMPSFIPTLGMEAGPINLVPVDFVAQAIDHIVAEGGNHGQCFHLTDPKAYTMGDAIQVFSKAANGPKFPIRVNANKLLNLVPKPLSSVVNHMPVVKFATDRVFDQLDMPRELIGMLKFGAYYDSRNTQRALQGTGIKVPDLREYAGTLWEYWERNLDKDSASLSTLEGRIRGRVVVVTGASSGIGKALAYRLAKAGAKVILVARGLEKLEETQRDIISLGGEAYVYPCDLSDLDACGELSNRILADHGRIDILVNNAGRSIRRSLKLTYDRFHDFERTMQLNYFGPVKLIMGCLPSMSEQQSGHIINISSIAVAAGVMPRFSAYAASKAALDAFSRCAGGEYRSDNVKFTNIHMPLVKTPMIGPTSIYNSVPTLTPEEAVDLIEKAIVKQPHEINNLTGSAMKAVGMISPDSMEQLMNIVYKVFPDSAAAKGQNLPAKDQPAPTSEQVALAAVLSGAHV
ncbi:MAG: SDR family oxidoreductase [Candidatus Pelagadaptatus aseana]|uniref:SDR family oxidoreductase n=1 Tax=Candidatus Pelagadaptatus aseana TaxID=3120508 RepID=UPI0039B13FE8